AGRVARPEAGGGWISSPRRRGAQALAGRLAVGALQVDVRVVAADGVLPRLAGIEAVDVPPDIVVGDPGLHVEGAALAEGDIGADALGGRLAPLVLNVDAAAGPVEIGGVVQIDRRGHARNAAVVLVSHRVGR